MADRVGDKKRIASDLLNFVISQIIRIASRSAKSERWMARPSVLTCNRSSRNSSPTSMAAHRPGPGNVLNSAFWTGIER